MKRSRWIAACAGLTLAATMAVPATIASAAPGDAALTIFHGLPGAGAVDVYVDGALVQAAFAEGANFEAELPAGTYTVEICGADVEAPNPLPETGCEFNVGFPNGGVDLTVADDTSYTVVAQYAGAGNAVGRPTIVAYVNDLSCVEPGSGRFSFINAGTVVVQDDDGPEVAAIQAVDTFDDGDLQFADVAGQSAPETEDRLPATFAFEIRNQVDEPLFSANVQSPLGFNYTTILVGNPAMEAEYDLLDINYELEDCVPVTTTTTTAPTTTHHGAAGRDPGRGSAPLHRLIVTRS